MTTTTTVTEKWLAGILAAVLLIACYAGYEVYQSHQRIAVAEAKSAVSEATIKANQDSIKQIQDQLVITNKALEAAKAAPESPKQFVIDVSKYIPSIPQQPTIITIPAQPAQPATLDHPAVPATPEVQNVVLPAADLQALRNYGGTCQEDKASLAACQLVGAKKDVDLKATIAERDVWENTAKGGTFWQRFGSAVRHTTCGGLGVAAGVSTSKVPGSSSLVDFGAGATSDGACELGFWLIGKAHKK